METYAKVVADSISPAGIRLTTMELCFHRFILPEFNTHRMFSRNAASSRAIPTNKLLSQVADSPAMPVHWGKNQPGMQADEELDATAGIGHWQAAADSMLDITYDMLADGYHKQLVNRLLEPFMWVKVIVTATEWKNFFDLRLHSAAQPEIALLASKMREAMEQSTPVMLHPGEWHLPYLHFDVISRGYFVDTISQQWYSPEDALKCSVARCARVSYLNHDNTQPNIEKDIALADRLLKDGHMSPFESVACPMDKVVENDISKLEQGVTHIDRYGNKWSGNFRGWYQYRQLV